VPSGSSLNTASVGTKSFSVDAMDNVGNSTPTATAGYTVSFGVQPTFDTGQPTRKVSLKLADANGTNVSAAGIVLTVTAIDGSPASGTFSFTKKPAEYSYQPKVSAGPHTVPFMATGDPFAHTISFIG
jgi:hypothetical protein